MKVWDDDAPFVGSWMQNTSWENDSPRLGTAISCVDAFGGWTPPGPKPGSKTFSYSHVYSKAGTFNISFTGFAWSGPPWSESSCYVAESDPYGGEVGGAIDIVVSPQPEATPSPSPTATPAPTPTSSPASA